jgi:hypothetical protein
MSVINIPGLGVNNGGLINNLSAGNLLNSLVNQVFVRPAGTTSGINGVYVFDIPEEEEVRLRNEVTDHVVEANYSIQDHVVLKPIEITLRGFVGELVVAAPQDSLSGIIPSPIMSILDSFAPKFSAQASAFYGKVMAVQNNVNRVITQVNNIYDLLAGNVVSGNKQQRAFNIFLGWRNDRVLCSVDMPFGTFTNMEIISLIGIQKGDSRMVSEFIVTFKQITTVDVSNGSSQNRLPVAIGRAAAAASAILNKGNVTGVPASPLTALSVTNVMSPPKFLS